MVSPKLLFFFQMLSISAAYAQLDLAQWINPGPLALPHASLEGVKQCALCHATAKGVPDDKCLACHTEIATRRKKRSGWHARQTEKCVHCHSDHQGREYDLLALKRVPFDHADTGWKLTGAHTKVECLKCHTQKRTNAQTGLATTRTSYLGAPVDCVGCHADIHKSQNPEFHKCDLCHRSSDWKRLRSRLAFDHNRDSAYPLTGRHGTASCYACHRQKTWKPLRFEACADCHVDPHKNKYGPLCESCHVTADWKKVTGQGESRNFDHDKTRFRLTGEHRQVGCTRCHGPVIGKMSSFAQCDGCHNNPHGSEFKLLWSRSKECTDCHVTDGWSILSFQHNSDSRYDLTDRHKSVPCEQCHVDRKYRWLTKTPDCDTCHMDAHEKQFTKTCASCHTPKGFEKATFDHNKDSPFPLVGKHAAVPCEKCHEGGKYKGIDRRCQGCHTDFHENQLGQECARCHSPRAFNEVEFDHKRESKFRVDGLHEKVACNQCHLGYRYRPLPLDCASCHDDVHNGTFGPSCDRCHSTASFKPRRGFHDFGEFSLGGAHDRLDCLSCHGPKSPVRTSPAQCSSCHKDPHMRSLGPNCGDCHTQRSWLPTTFRHNRTGFELSGAHRFVSCDRCHFNRVFGGLPQDCLFCHQKDFARSLPGHATAGNECESCHFTRGWRPTRK